MSPLSGHAILCSQGKRGRGAVPSLLCTGLGSVPSLGGAEPVRDVTDTCDVAHGFYVEKEKHGVRLLTRKGRTHAHTYT